MHAAMTPALLVCIQSDPMETHRPVEGLRIALGLSTGVEAVTIVFLGRARLLLTEDAGDVVDAEILEKHLPVVRELGLDLVVPEGSADDFSLTGERTVREMSDSDIAALLFQSSRSLVF